MREALGTILLIIQASLLIPLIFEVYRSRSSQGISLIGELLWVVAGLGWIAYGWMTGSNVLIASGSFAFIGSLVVSALIWGNVAPAHQRRSLLVCLVLFALFAGSVLIFHATGLSIALSVFGIVQFLPQFKQSLADVLSSTGGEGVPIIGTGLRSLYTLTWGLYAGAWFLWGLLPKEIDYPLAVWGLMGSLTFGLQFWAGIKARKQKTTSGLKKM